MNLKPHEIMAIAMAAEIAAKNPHKHRFGCVTTDAKNMVVATAENNPVKSHPLQARYADQVGLGKKIYLHSEIAALVKSRCNTPKHLYVVRMKADNTFGMARPCPVCMEAIKASGVEVIYYSGYDGSIHKEMV